MTRIIIVLVVLFTPSLAFAKVNVVATLPDLAAIAREVGGDRVKVKALASPAVDPHYVDPRPNLILHLNKADLLILNGLQLEDAWLGPLVKQARNKKINVGATGHFIAADYARLIEVPKGKLDRSEGDVHPGGNPHFYSDPTSAISIANALGKRLSKIDPDGSSTYASNAKEFTDELWKVAKAQSLRFARLPASKRKVVSYHESLGYLYRWLNLEEVATVEPKPGIPPNPKHVAGVLKTMKSTGADVIVQEEYYPRKTSQTLARMTNADLVVLHGGTHLDDGETYIERIRTIAKELYDAVSK